MIELRKAWLEKPSVEFQRLNWIIKPTTEDISTYYFSILRSNSPEGPFSLVAERIQNRFHYEDFEINQHSEYRVFYYVLRITNPTGTTYSDSESVRLTVEPSPIALELIRKKTVALNNGSTAGIDGKLYIRKTWGTYCSCFDHVKKRKALSNCPVCLGTNYVGGYFDPVDIRMFFNVTQKQIENLGFETNPVRQVFETTNYPIVSPGDIIRHEQEGNYRVGSVRSTSRETYTVSQFAQVEKINTNDIEYDLGGE